MFVVTLVHGTWGRGIFFLSEIASWTHGSSPLCKALRETLGAEVEFRRFAWSGANSHGARSRAAEQLRGCLRDGLARWPDAAHYVIAHSHGGNVTLSALADTKLEEKVAGVVCLATPFLAAQERDLGQNPWEHLLGALVIIFVPLWWLMDYVLLPASWPGPVRFSLTVVVTTVSMSSVMWFIEKWREFAAQMKEELALPPIDPAKILIVRSPADEASAILAICQSISQLTVRLYLKAQTAYEWYVSVMCHWSNRKRRMIALSVGAFLTSLGLIFAAANLPLERGELSMAQKAVAAFAFGSIFVSVGALSLAAGWIEITTVFVRVATAAVVWPVIALLSGLLLPFGREAAMANILLNVTAEATPPGSWMVHLIEPPTSKELDTNEVPLMHSVIYENPRAIKCICDWIVHKG